MKNITKNNLWMLYQELVRMRISDNSGNAYCDFCSAYENNTRMHIGVYVKKNFPLWFDGNNNYICCDKCLDNIPKEKINEARKRYKGINLTYTQHDINQAYATIALKIKNHIGWIKKIQT